MRWRQLPGLRSTGERARLGARGKGSPGRKHPREVLEDGSLLKGKDEQNQTPTFKISLATVCEC